jgi:hypothetical protein
MNHQIDSRAFKSKKDALEYTRTFLNNLFTSGKCKITQSCDEFEYIMAVLNRHKYVKEKVGCGISYFEIFQVTNYGKKGIGVQIVRSDMTEENFSWRKCVELTTGTMKPKIVSVFRASINKQISDFRDNSVLTCVKCGSSEHPQIDHKNPTFQQMFDDFTGENGLPTDVYQDKDNLAPVFLPEDKIYEDRWVSYHKENATLRVLCRNCNCSRKKY